MTAHVDFWFDFSCPYAYLASTQVEAMAARSGATLHPKPMLLGGVFRAVDQPQNLAATLQPAKAKHMADDLRRFAAHWDVPLVFPQGHPLRTVTALRTLLVVGEPYLPLAHAFYRAYWVDGVDISTDEGVASVLTREGHDANAVLAQTQSPAIKDALRALTDEAIAAGVFGAPAFVVDGVFFWGQDRMDQVERALGATPTRLTTHRPAAPTDFWFDFSSPFAAIASAGVEAMFGDAVRFRPMLLGAVFRAVGTDNVPLATFSQAKRDWAKADMMRQAEGAGFPFRWPSRFPMRTVLPLRVLLQIGPDTPAGRAFVRATFRAYWSEDRDISQPEVVAAIADSLALDGAQLVAGAADQASKDALRASTEAAVADGVFGAPTFVVHRPDGERSLFWGADRLELASRAARGAESLY
ncbi:MAG: 2-hydroxychromene-2-carboxylate isomerase, partial [Myxococcota bacterium]|nr:2-hydroxychromene-2-carboxylate isomerase [Myxococcota bacterium]